MEINTVKSNVTPVITRKKTFFIVLGIVAVGFGGYWWYAEKLSKIEIEQNISANPVAYIQNNSEAAAAVESLNTGDYSSAYSKFEILAKSEKNKEVKESLTLYAAAALMEVDRERAVAYYKSIYDNQSFLKANRAYALLKVLQYSLAENNLSYLYPFLDEQKDLKNLTKNQINYEVNEKIYTLYPYSIAAVRLARLELKESPSKEKALQVISKYQKSIETGRTEMLTREGLRQMAANTILNEAQLSQDLEKFELKTATDTMRLFDLAYSTSKLYSPKPTQQFILLIYANYLAGQNKNDEALTLLKIINDEGPRAAIKTNLSSPEGKKEYQGLIQLALKNEEAHKFFSQFGW